MNFPVVLYQDREVVMHLKRAGSTDVGAKFLYQIQRIYPSAATVHSKLYDSIADCVCEGFSHLSNMLYGHS